MSWSDDEWDADEALNTKNKKEEKAVRSEDEAVDSEEEAAEPQKADEPKNDGPKPDEKIVAKDSLADLQLNLQKDVDQLVKMLVPKIKKAQAKKAPNKFLTSALTTLGEKVTLEEATSLHKICKEMHTKRKAAEKKREEEEKAQEEKDEKEKKAAEQREKGMVDDEEFFKDFM
eukprot:TRINITY_DN6248_c0_g1_i1.p2 TRINITY_DN6248_c0_g1~~TRINITY_DN6248_c0_g1_i1.p2  ORF type:complete len:173 (-),score=88.88 TRINITY_DN6248_c0_g1_i1:172-690(-)